MAQKRRGPERGRGTEGPGPGMRVARGAGARGGQRARGGGGPRAPSGPQGREEGDAVPGRDVTTLGRTHETLVEADQPRLPVVVENQNRLNHRCRPRSSPPGCSQKTPTSATTRTLPVGCAAESSPAETLPGAQGPGREESGFPIAEKEPGPAAGPRWGGWWGPRDPELGRVVSAVSLAGTRARIGVLGPGRPPASPSSWEKQVPTQERLREAAGGPPFSASAPRHDVLLFPL